MCTVGKKSSRLTCPVIQGDFGSEMIANSALLGRLKDVAYYHDLCKSRTFVNLPVVTLLLCKYR